MFVKGNVANIFATIPINISTKPNVVENVYIYASSSPEEVATYRTLLKEFHDVFTWSYEDMSGIDPSILEHEIRTYPSVKHV